MLNSAVEMHLLMLKNKDHVRLILGKILNLDSKEVALICKNIYKNKIVDEYKIKFIENSKLKLNYTEEEADTLWQSLIYILNNCWQNYGF
jgi:hypothetical protein